MKIKFKYLDNFINTNNEKIFVLEVTNKRYFYRIVKDLINASNAIYSDDLIFFDDNNKEINPSIKLKVINNYFNFEFDSKRYSSDLNKYFISNTLEESKIEILSLYNRLIKRFNKELNNIDLPVKINVENDFEFILKLLKLSINQNDNLMLNLLLLIDIENTFKTKNILIFINLKQYITDTEIEELYKYAIYNEVSLLLIDSQTYGVTKENENKLIIDENLDEFMLK